MHRTPTLLVPLALLTACSPTPPAPTSQPPVRPEAPGEPEHEPPEAGPVAFPSWVGFPADPTALQAAIDARDTQPLRAHAWRLWAGLNQPISASDPSPLWWTWATTTQVVETPQSGPLGATAMSQHRHAARKLERAKAGARSKPTADDDHTDECYDARGNGQIFFPSPTYVLPAALLEQAGLDPNCAQAPYAAANGSTCTLPDGTHFQNNGDIMVATESYNRPGAETIEARHYNEASTFAALRSDGVKMLPGLSPQQVTTKHMYWPVKATGLSALPVFRELPRAQWCQYNGYETWATLVAVDPSGDAGKTGAVEFLFGVWDHAGKKALPTKRAEAEVHSLESFYHQQITPAAWEAMDPKDRMLLDAASRWAHGQPFEPGDFVISIGSHIISKEIPQWTLQTAWWTDRPDDGPYAADRPALPEAQGPWAHYLMTTAYGIPTEPGGETLPVAFNPYIELAATHPVATNCRNCHLRAGWPSGSGEDPGGQYLTPTGPGPLANLSTDDPLFDGLLLTDFQWVLAGRVKAK